MSLRQLRILDESGRISLTNISVAAALIIFAIHPEISASIVVIATLAGYQYKRQFSNPVSDLAALEAKVIALTATVEETKGKMSAIAMKASITPGFRRG